MTFLHIVLSTLLVTALALLWSNALWISLLFGSLFAIWRLTRATGKLAIRGEPRKDDPEIAAKAKQQGGGAEPGLPAQ